MKPVGCSCVCIHTVPCPGSDPPGPSGFNSAGSDPGGLQLDNTAAILL